MSKKKAAKGSNKTVQRANPLPGGITYTDEPRSVRQPVGAENVRIPKQEIVITSKVLDERRMQGNHLISALTKAATDIATIDVDKMERLWIMNKEAEDRRAELEFGIAKNALARVIPPIPKKHKISFVDKDKKLRETPYANREDIEAVIGPLYREAGFSTEYTTDYIDGKIQTLLIVRHNSGHKEVYKSPPMPLDTSGSKNNNQAAGSTSEYGARYCLKGAFNVMGVDVDDDGAGGIPHATGDDKFTQRATEQSEEANPPAQPAGDQQQPETKAPTTDERLKSVANTLAEKLQAENSAERRGAILMANMPLLKSLELAGMAAIVENLRKLAEEKVNG